LSDRDFDDLDDLFEPFELTEAPARMEPEPTTGQELHPSPPVQAPYDAVTCQSCGAANPSSNHHCEQCGARLGTSALPVATPPLARASAGGRAVTVLTAVVVVVAFIALLFNLRGDDTTTGAEGSSTSTSTSTSIIPRIDQLEPTSVDASSSFSAAFGPENLIDGDTDTYWNDAGLRGEGATLTFRFAQPVQIFDIEIQNLVDEVKFRRNYRIKSYVITVDDLPAVERTGMLDDNNTKQTIAIGSRDTRELVIRVTDTYPAQAVGDDPPFEELALQSVRFFGVPSDGG
jgi:hypothetical protein